MLLLDKDKLGTNSSASVSARKICIISDREAISLQIAQLLRTRGLEQIDIIPINFLDENESFKLSAETYVGAIIDIQDTSNIQDVLIRTHSVIPQNLWCCLVGDNDSISFSQSFAGEGLLYFHSASQLYQMAERIISGVDIPIKRHTVKITVLGCKGGIGSSLIAFHLAHRIVNESKVPVLLVQGKGGSQDLDVFCGKKVAKGEIVEYSEHLDLYRGELSSLNEDIISSYNYIVYDQPIFNIDKEDYPDFLKISDNFVVVTNRNVASLRVAKSFITELERLKIAEERLIRRFVCISDHHIELAKSMSIADIERLLNTEIDAIVPYVSKTNIKNALMIKFGRRGDKQLKKLTQSVIGVLSRKYQSRKQQGLRAYLGKLLTGK
ncbi:pilus assembly protein [Avibacterium paragallinarum]|uniref:pilus assembly protein n=1 Tax=Avibacterium paragallinarum TaxID=728 RepID=UPI00397BFDB9